MSKTRQRVETPYNMGYKDGWRGVSLFKDLTQLTNQYYMGYMHGSQARKDRTFSSSD